MMMLGLTGWPVSHSLSPRLHNSALRMMKIDGNYDLYPADPATPGALLEVIRMLRERKLDGLNVTIPHKQTVMAMLDELTPVAQAVGAVNTIYRSNDRLIGHNTDVDGFRADLANATGSMLETPGKAIVIGSGGSARAVVSALAREKWEIFLTSRNYPSANDLASGINHLFGKKLITYISPGKDFYDLPMTDINLVVNTTPVGMLPDVKSSPWPDEVPFPEQAVIYDLIYKPSETLFVKQARGAGLRAYNGLGMLVEQAALALEMWTGQAVSREVMKTGLD